METNVLKTRAERRWDKVARDPYRISAKTPPKYRGVLHRWMILPSLAAGIWLIFRATGTGATIAVGIYVATISLMFALSSLFHFKVIDDRKWSLLRKLDHTGIYLLIAGTYLAITGLSLEGAVRVVLLSSVWGIILLFIIMEWLPVIPPKGLTNTLFLLAGWFSIGASKWLWESLGVLGFLLLLAGGFAYTYGATILGFRKPNPSPKYFGYHEIWHIAVVIGVIFHFLVVALVLL